MRQRQRTVVGVSQPLLGDPGDLSPDGICADLPIAEAFELARLLRDAGSPDLALNSIADSLFATDDGWFGVSLWPRAPDGFPECTDFGS